ncbi:uncharacterized protein LOC124196515 isoform X2 [Daphnia pulex]|nr:uncharacterized protein LOC124196515 isoform X2 [Daphnia pulex]
MKSKDKQLTSLEKNIREIKDTTNSAREIKEKEIKKLMENTVLLQNCVLKIKSEKVVVEKEAAKLKHENGILKKNIEPSFQVNPLQSVGGHLTHDECQQKLHLLSDELYKKSSLIATYERKMKQIEQENKELQTEINRWNSHQLKMENSGEHTQQEERTSLDEKTDSNQMQTFPVQVPQHIPVLHRSHSTRTNYFLDVKSNRNDCLLGRIVIESRPESAPEMCRVFHNFVCGIGGIYLGSKMMKGIQDKYIIFQNAIVKDGGGAMFPADENDLVIRRGAIGMRSQGFENGRKLVKSQFYIVLSDNPPSDGQFSYVFGYLTAGYSVCDELNKKWAMVKMS